MKICTAHQVALLLICISGCSAIPARKILSDVLPETSKQRAEHLAEIPVTASSNSERPIGRGATDREVPLSEIEFRDQFKYDSTTLTIE